MPTPNKQYYVYIPGSTQGTFLSAEDYEAKKDKIKQYQDAEVFEMQDLADDSTDSSDYYVNIPGSTQGTRLTADQYKAKRDKIRSFKDAEVYRKVDPFAEPKRFSDKKIDDYIQNMYRWQVGQTFDEHYLEDAIGQLASSNLNLDNETRNSFADLSQKIRDVRSKKDYDAVAEMEKIQEYLKNSPKDVVDYAESLGLNMDAAGQIDWSKAGELISPIERKLSPRDYTVVVKKFGQYLDNMNFVEKHKGDESLIF